MNTFLSMMMGYFAGWLIHQTAYYLPIYSGKAAPIQPYPRTSAFCLLFGTAEIVYPQHDFYLALLLEFVTAASFGLFSLLFPAEMAFKLSLSYCFLMLIAVIDMRYRLILNVMSYSAMLLMLAYRLIYQNSAISSYLLGFGFVFAIFYFTAVLRPKQLGSGDIKLASLLGLAFGFPNVLWALLLGAGLGGIVAIGMLLSGRYTLKTRIPYAPFLCFGAMLFLLYQAALV